MLDVVRPGDPACPAVRHVYTATGSPAAVVLPRSAAEVADALAFARDAGGPLSVRSGGHGMSSISTNDGGTVIDLSRLDAVHHVRDDLVRVGPGARWGDVAAELAPRRLAISSGDSGDVGIVTSFTFRAATVPAVAHATFQYRIPELAPFLRRWGETVEAAPRTVSAFLHLFGPDVALATVVVADRHAAAALAPFSGVAPLLGRRAELVPYASVVTATHAPHLGRQRARTHSGLAVHLDDRVTDRIADLVEQGFGQLLQIRSMGGAINDVPADATAYAHRHQNFSVTAVASDRRQEFDAAWNRVRPVLDGLYLSFESAFTLQALTDAFPPATLRRLRRLKAEVDPDGVFNQNFPVTEAAGRAPTSLPR